MLTSDMFFQSRNIETNDVDYNNKNDKNDNDYNNLCCICLLSMMEFFMKTFHG